MRSTACQACPVGHKCPRVGMSAPESCPEGEYTNQTSQEGCYPCEAGQQCPNGVRSVPCPAGYFSKYGQSNCTACKSGEYSKVGSSECLPCPAGKQCVGPALEPVNCTYGTYSGQGENVCKPCPQGKCNEKDIMRTRARLTMTSLGKICICRKQIS